EGEASPTPGPPTGSVGARRVHAHRGAPRRKGALAGPGDDADPDLVVGVDLAQPLRDSRVHRAVHGVELLRPVERESRDVPGAFEANRHVYFLKRCFWILPVGVLGSSSSTSTMSGTMNLGTRARRNSRRSSGSTVMPGLGTTATLRSSSVCGEGT